MSNIHGSRGQIFGQIRPKSLHQGMEKAKQIGIVKETNNPIKNWAEIWTDIPLKKTYRWPRYTRKDAQLCSLFSSVPSFRRVRLCDPMDCSTPGLPVHHQLPEFTQTHVHRVGDAIQPSLPLLCSLLKECKSKLHWGITSHWLGWLSSKDPQTISAGEGVEKWEPSYTFGLTELVQLLWRFLKKLKIELPYDSEVPLLGIGYCCCVVIKSCPTLCNPTDFSQPGGSVHGILQARILKRVVISSSRVSSQPRDRTHDPCIGSWILYCWATKEAPCTT